VLYWSGVSGTGFTGSFFGIEKHHIASGGVVYGELSAFPATGGIPFIPICDPYGEAGELLFSPACAARGTVIQ
jgi:hypothetical protein